MPKLVIVESPAKAKTIGKYLGRGYKVTASMGHVRDLPASQLGIDIEHGYTPKYITIKGKQKLVKELKAEAKKCDGVLLATDPDREGEAISWHLANLLGLDPAAPNRVTFDEITKKGVKEGMAHPRAIDMDLFNAQQARREPVSYTHLDVYKRQGQVQAQVMAGLLAVAGGTAGAHHAHIPPTVEAGNGTGDIQRHRHVGQSAQTFGVVDVLGGEAVSYTHLPRPR